MYQTQLTITSNSLDFYGTFVESLDPLNLFVHNNYLNGTRSASYFFLITHCPFPEADLSSMDLVFGKI